MERTVLLAAATWVGGVGAWTVAAGYALAPHVARTWHARMGADELGGPNGAPEAPTPPVETIDTLPAPPLPLDSPETSPKLRSANPDDSPTFESLADAEAQISNLRRREDPSKRAASELQLRRPEGEAGGVLTESQRRRLAPIKSLRRTRRSRKLRTAGSDEEKFVPIVKGARATTSESIVAAYNGETLDVKREQGEDYWVDPAVLQSELDAKEKSEARRKKFKESENAYAEGKLRAEIAAPYKNNVIGGIVLGVGALGVLFNLFPGLLELNEPGSIASFPADL